MRRVPLLLVIVTAVVIALGLLLLAGCSGGGGGYRPATDLPEPEGLSRATTETVIYYATGRTILGERRVIDAEEPYADALRTLLAAMPESNPDVAIVQPEAGFNSVTFSDGVITVDWMPEVLDFVADPEEKRLALGAILATFGAFPEVEQVRFTVDGVDSGEVNGKDVASFWVDVSLLNQPWDVLRVGLPSGENEGSTETTEAP